jgi:hypothetical protein
MIRMLTSGALLVTVCAVLAAGASAAAPAPTAPIGDKCSTLLPNSLLASVLPTIYGRPTTLAGQDNRAQSWDEKKKETWSVKSPASPGFPIEFTHTAPGSSACAWGSEGWVYFGVWYASHGKEPRAYELPSARGPYPNQAWQMYSTGTSSQLRARTDVSYWCSGGVPLEGLDTRDCDTQAVSGIGERAAEGLGYIVFQEKGNTYMIKGRATDVRCLGLGANPAQCPAGSTAPILPYATLEALARKVASEVAASPPPTVTVTCAGFAYQCGPTPYS